MTTRSVAIKRLRSTSVRHLGKILRFQSSDKKNRQPGLPFFNFYTKVKSEANPQVHVETPLHPEKLSRFGPVNWPPRSCDLTPLDYFLWGYGKSLVYADKPQTLDHLEDKIRRVIADIRPQMLEKVIENWTSRLDYIRAIVVLLEFKVLYLSKNTLNISI
ncbi:hypothetical protein TNCV_4377631 [Trichonephila clavipes]|nr:hypothetical protein TNCV_4377631 [Trichonephila clavipes]